MDAAGLSCGRAAHTGAAVRSNDPRNRRPHGAIRPESHPVDHPTATADHRQADYFLRLLTHSRSLIDQRIDEYRKAIVSSEARGNAEAAGTDSDLGVHIQHSEQRHSGNEEGP